MFQNQARWVQRALGAAAVGGALTLVLAGGPAGAQTANANGRQFVNGSVTSVHGTSVQVSDQTQNSESTVTLSPTTQISKRESATASAITTGTCVRVIGTGSATKGITARTVAVSPATSNGCDGLGDGRARRTGRPGGQGGPGGAGAQGRPGGFRAGGGQRPNGNANRRFPGGGNFANFAIANGPVQSVSGDTLVVKSTTFARPTSATTKAKAKAKSAKAKSAKTSTSQPKATTSDVKVTLASSTAITQTVAGTADDVVAGSCVTATGTTAGAGITADRVNVTAPVNGTCTGGFGGRFGGGSGGGAGNGQV